MVISKAVCVVDAKGGSQYALNEKNLRSVLDVDGVRDRKIVVVSLVGAARTGKSTLANFFLRYLDSKYGPSNEPTTDEMGWMKGDEHLPLLGFPWSSWTGSKTITKGIWMSSTAYLTSLKNEKVAIVVLDSQGLNDRFTTSKDWATILAFVGMVSSVTCYNVMNELTNLELNSLMFFCEYGKVAVQTSDKGSTPLQNLMFIIRDWTFSRAYGEKEGSKHLDYWKEGFRSQFEANFNRVSCFVLPSPGMRADAQDYHGSISQLSEPFKTHLHDLVKLLFDPENLVMKKISKETVTAEQFIDCFKTYIVLLQRKELPAPTSLFHLTVEAYIRANKTAAKNLYVNTMKEKMNRASPGPLSDEEFKEEHRTAKKLALDAYDRRPTIGGTDISAKYRPDLESELDKLYRMLRVENKRKLANVSQFRVYRLAATTLLFAIALELVVSRWKWHRFITLIFNVTCKWVLLGILTWVYILHRNRQY